MTPEPASPPPESPPRKPWPLSWILIAILGYVVFQTAYFLFFAK